MRFLASICAICALASCGGSGTSSPMQMMDPGTPPPGQILQPTLATADLTSHEPFVQRIRSSSVAFLDLSPDFVADFNGELLLPMGGIGRPYLQMLGDLDVTIDLNDPQANNNIVGTLTNLNIFENQIAQERLEIEFGRMVVAGRFDGRQRSISMRVDGRASGMFDQDTVGMTTFILTANGRPYDVVGLSEQSFAGTASGVTTGHYISNTDRNGRFFLLQGTDKQPD